MNALVTQYFFGESHFDEVVFLSKQSEWTWEKVCTHISAFPKGWYALTRVSSEDRIEFMADFWLRSLPFHPKLHVILLEFFQKLDDLDVVVTRQGEHWGCELIYSLKDESSFFRGLPPATPLALKELHEEISVSLPSDYISFLTIHNGFGKLSELNLLQSNEILEVRKRLEQILHRSQNPVTCRGVDVNPRSLFPFYEVLGLNSFQCFYADWYPGGEMGNVYFSGIDYTISDISVENHWIEQLAFPTFLEWLAHYLGGMSLSL